MAQVTHDGSRWSNAELDRVELVPYDPGWRLLFQEESAAIRGVLPRGLEPAIEHIGSTAIPGIPAKPIIDILVGVEPSFDWSTLVDPIQSLGYVFWAENPRSDHMFFVKGMPPFGRRRTHHVHVHEPGEEFHDRIAFRDHLRTHPEIAERYGTLKRRLASQFAGDRDGYTAAKIEFVRRVLAASRLASVPRPRPPSS